MSKNSCDRTRCDFVVGSKLCDTLDRAGVPPDQKWRTLILYMRGLSEFTYLTEHQKLQIQALLVEILKNRDYSDDNYERILQRDRDIRAEPLEKRVRSALEETARLADEFRELMLARKGDVARLEESSVDAVRSGADPETVVRMLRSTFNEVLTVMEQDAASLEEVSRTDFLTGIANRRAFEEMLHQGLHHWQQQNVAMAMIMIDIDHFKEFNDQYGHRIGDQALRAVAGQLQAASAAYAGEGRVVFPSRYGGEEFAIIALGLGDDMLCDLAEYIRQKMEEYEFTLRDSAGNIVQRDIRITLSLGVAVPSRSWAGSWAENLVDMADAAMYEAKHNGRNRVCSHIKPQT